MIHKFAIEILIMILLYHSINTGALFTEKFSVWREQGLVKVLARVSICIQATTDVFENRKMLI